MSLFICLALPPMALYLLAIGLVNLRPRPLLISGVRDVNCLGLALSGFAVAGPLELFLPETAAFKFGPWVWLLMLTLYFLVVSLWGLIAIPRLVIYNVTLEQVRPLMSEIARGLDSETRWAADSLVVPKLGLRLHLEPSPRMRCIQLVATGHQQDFEGWRRFERHLRERLHPIKTTPNLQGIWAVLSALLLVFIVGWAWLRDCPTLVTQFHSLLRT